MGMLFRQPWRHTALGILGLLLVTFALPHLLPGAPHRHYTAWPDTLSQLEQVKSEYGFDRPLPIQFALWLQRLGRGQWGYSRFYQRPVFPQTFQALGNTLWLLIWAALACGLWHLLRRAGGACLGWLGLVVARPPRSIGLEVLPGFLVAIILHEIAIWQFGWIGLANMALFHPHYMVNPGVMLLPAFAVALLPLSIWSGSRPSMVPEEQPAWLRFQSHWRQFQEAFGPLLGVFLLEVLLTEHIFTFPGLGRFGISALKRRDVPALQGFLLGIGLLYLGLRLLCALRRKRLDAVATGPAQPPEALRQARQTLYRGTLGLLVVLALAACAPQLWPYDPAEIHAHDQLVPPNGRYIFGTDFLGRDVLSRTIEGFRSTMPRLLMITAMVIGLSMLLAGLGRLVQGAGTLLRYAYRGLTAGLPPCLLVFIVFLIVEHRSWALETALTIACLPIAMQVTAGSLPYRVRMAKLAQLGEALLMFEVIFYYLNLGPELLTPNWGSDLRLGMHYSHKNMWLLLAPGLAVVWMRYILRQFQAYSRLITATPDRLASAIPTPAAPQ